NASNGSFTITNGRNFIATAAFGNLGSVTIGPGSTLSTGAGNYLQQSLGTTTLAAASSGLDPLGIFDLQGGRLFSFGTIQANLQSAGQVNPGSSPGVMTVNGNYSQAAAGALNIEIAGTNAATPDFDQLVVNGNAALGGALNVTLINGFVPAI